MRIIIAVDPGVGGGFCVGDDDSGGLLLAKMPDSLVGIKDLLVSFKTSKSELWIEDVPKFCGKFRPESTIAVLFQNVGRVEGIAAALGIPIHRVTPKVWQGSLGVGVRGDLTYPEWKRKLKNKAAELFPAADVTLKTADAILIWHFAMGGGR